MLRAWLAVVLLCSLCVGAHAQDRVLPGQPNENAVAAYERGERLLARGKLEQAAAAFDEAAKEAPLFHLAHYAAGNALAQAVLARALQVHP